VVRLSGVDPSVGLGLDLAGNSRLDTMSVFVAGIHPESPVAHDGRVHVGDELLEVEYVRGFAFFSLSGVVAHSVEHRINDQE